MRKSLIALALTASAFGAVACSAQTPPTPPQDGGQRMMKHHGGAMRGMMGADANHDGAITRAEVLAEADARFAKLDTNHDGTISADERLAMRQAMHDRMVANGKSPPPADGKREARRGDRDGDRMMTKADFEARALKRFDRMDANHDGTLDKTELANAAEMTKLRHRERRSGDMPAPPPPPADNGE